MGLRSLLPSSSLTVALLTLVLLVRTTSGQPLYQTCYPSGNNYTANGTYESNLRLLLSSLAAKGSASGYSARNEGDVPDTVYGFVLCRGDVDPGPCRSCLERAAQDVIQACPYRKGAAIWYDNCLLRYMDKWEFPAVSGSSIAAYMNTQNVTESELPLFNEQLEKMMRSLASYAAYNSPDRMFATGDAVFTVADPKIYGLVQCTTDQAAKDCKTCLTGIISQIPQYFFGKRGARILGTFCYFRYEVYPFYNRPAMVSIPSGAPEPSPALPSPPPSDVPTSKGTESDSWLSFHKSRSDGLPIQSR